MRINDINRRPVLKINDSVKFWKINGPEDIYQKYKCDPHFPIQNLMNKGVLFEYPFVLLYQSDDHFALFKPSEFSALFEESLDRSDIEESLYSKAEVDAAFWHGYNNKGDLRSALKAIPELDKYLSDRRNKIKSAMMEEKKEPLKEVV